MSFISLTRLRIRSWRFLPMFFYYAVQTLSQAKKAPGNEATLAHWGSWSLGNHIGPMGYLLMGLANRAIGSMAQ
ncbi:MAG: hypothetical protein KA205_10180 [Acidobacteria bacterium]|nr:hypothetical protein [Acidobacteriota bacterium]